MTTLGYRKPLALVLLDKIEFDDCWEWTASRDRHGYGQLNRGHKLCRAHRVVYEWLIGPVPKGLDLDHLCRNRGCVNPAHLEPVTRKVNVERGIDVNAARKAQTHCKRGHEYTEETVYLTAAGSRQCRPCQVLLRRERDK